MENQTNTTETTPEVNFEDYCTRNNLETPQQVRDQVLFNMLSAISVKMGLDDEERRLLYYQEAIFRAAQKQGV